MREWTRRRLLTATAGSTVGALAGCAGLGTDSTGPSTTSKMTSETDTTAAQTTSDDESRESPGYLEYHWHGKLLMDIDGRLVDFDRPKYYLDNIDDEAAVYFHFHDSAHGSNEWSNEKQTVTLAEGLNLLPDMQYRREGDANLIAHEGTTFDGRSAETTVTIYEGTEAIDPTQHQVEHNQNFWIHVDTGSGSGTTRESDAGTSEQGDAGTTTGSGDWAKTGTLLVDVNNRRLDFSHDVYLSAGTEAFEFRDDGEPHRWYSGEESVTLETALDTLPNIAYSQADSGNHVIEYQTGESFTGTYRDGSDETEILVRRRAEPLDPTTYGLQDGDIIWVYVHTTEAPDNEH